jgi:hypothetical protein
MFVWILILSASVALLLLILHDATKEDSNGSAISIAAKNFKAFIFWSIQKSISKPPVKVATAVKAISSSSKSKARKKKWWGQERRVSITTPELELAISEAVKEAAPGCEDFVGVIVQHENPRSHLDSNWTITGIRFGTSDRKMANEALAAVVERMKREFLLSDVAKDDLRRGRRGP